MPENSHLSTNTNEDVSTHQELKNPIKVSLAFFSVTAPPKPPKIPRYVLYGKADVDLEWQGYTFRLQSFTWEVRRQSGKITIIFPNKVYPDPENKPGRRAKKFTVPTFSVIPSEGYRDIYHDIVGCIQEEVHKHFGPLIDEYMKHKGAPNMYGKVQKKSWQIRPHYDIFREAERKRWDNPPPKTASDPIAVEVVELYEDEKCKEGGSTARYAIKGTAHIDLKLEGYTFEIRNLFWGVKHKSYETRVKSPKQRHLTQDKNPDKRFITLGFRPFTPKGNKDLQLKIEENMIHEILQLYAKDIEQRKPEFQKAYQIIHSDIKHRRKVAALMKKKTIS